MIEKYVVEYSKSQNCFNITTLEKSINTNKQIFKNKISSDYQIIELSDSYEEASSIVKELRKELEKC